VNGIIDEFIQDGEKSASAAKDPNEFVNTALICHADAHRILKNLILLINDV